MLAVSSGQNEHASLFLKFGAYVDIQDRVRNTVFVLCCVLLF